MSDKIWLNKSSLLYPWRHTNSHMYDSIMLLCVPQFFRLRFLTLIHKHSIWFVWAPVIGSTKFFEWLTASIRNLSNTVICSPFVWKDYIAWQDRLFNYWKKCYRISSVDWVQKTFSCFSTNTTKHPLPWHRMTHIIFAADK